MYSPNPRAKRVEFRTPDPSCNGYLAFAAMLMAGLDGIEKRIDPGEPIDKNLYDLPPACQSASDRAPRSASKGGSDSNLMMILSESYSRQKRISLK